MFLKCHCTCFFPTPVSSCPWRLVYCQNWPSCPRTRATPHNSSRGGLHCQGQSETAQPGLDSHFYLTSNMDDVFFLTDSLYFPNNSNGLLHVPSCPCASGASSWEAEDRPCGVHDERAAFSNGERSGRHAGQSTGQLPGAPNHADQGDATMYFRKHFEYYHSTAQYHWIQCNLILLKLNKPCLCFFLAFAPTLHWVVMETDWLVVYV